MLPEVISRTAPSPRGALPRQPVSVLFVIDQLCKLGGAERVLLNIVERLPRDRFAPQLLTFRVDPEVAAGLRVPCPFHVMPLRRTWGLDAAKAAWRLRNLVRRERIDIVHTFFETSDLWAGAIARLSGCRVLISSRRDMGILRSAKHRLAYRLANPLFDEIHAVSEQVRRYAIEHDGLPPRKVRTVYNGVALERAAAAGRPPAMQMTDAASHRIVTVGHIRSVKGMDVFVEAAAKVRSEFPRAAFTIVGGVHDGAYHRKLLELRRTLGLDAAVHFTGPVDDVFPLLKSADVFCLLSRSEGLSNALLEAMACGLPCVATEVGGNPELVRQGETGFLVPAADPGAAGAAILALLRDPDLARAMGAAGRSLVERRFSVEAMIDELVRSYERLLDEHPA